MKKLFTLLVMTGLSFLNACGSEQGENLDPAITAVFPLAGAPRSSVALSIENYDPIHDLVTFGDVPVVLSVTAMPTSSASLPFITEAQAGETGATRYVTVPDLPDGIYSIMVRRGEHSSARQFQVRANVVVVDNDAEKEPNADEAPAKPGASSTTSPTSQNSGTQAKSQPTNTSGTPSPSKSDMTSAGSSTATPPALPGNTTAQQSVVDFKLSATAANYVSLSIAANYIKSLLLVAPDDGAHDPFAGYDNWLGDDLNPFGQKATTDFAGLLGLSAMYAPTNYTGYRPMNYCNIPSKDDLAYEMQNYGNALCFSGAATNPVDEAYNYIAIFLPVEKNSSSSSDGTIKVDAPYYSNVFTLYYTDWAGKMQAKSLTVKGI